MTSDDRRVLQMRLVVEARLAGPADLQLTLFQELDRGSAPDNPD